MANPSRCPPPNVSVRIGDTIFPALLHTGNINSVISEEHLASVQTLSGPRPYDCWIDRPNPTYRQFGITITPVGSILLPITFYGRHIDLPVHIARDLPVPLMLGLDYMNMCGTYVDDYGARIVPAPFGTWKEPDPLFPPELSRDPIRIHPLLLPPPVPVPPPWPPGPSLSNPIMFLHRPHLSSLLRTHPRPSPSHPTMFLHRPHLSSLLPNHSHPPLLHPIMFLHSPHPSRLLPTHPRPSLLHPFMFLHHPLHSQHPNHYLYLLLIQLSRNLLNNVFQLHHLLHFLLPLHLLFSHLLIRSLLLLLLSHLRW